MKINEIKELLNVIDKTNLEFVKIESSDLKLEVSKSSNRIVNNDLRDSKHDLSENANCEEVVSDICEEAIEETIEDNINIHVVSAPLMGTFYSSPNPDEGNFVKVGDIIKAGDTLCILEAMKLMNEINSNVSGEVIEILVENEELVEYGQPMFKIKAL
ncbi:acetyl-CoA carboxylase biotin carboxyl carrier protein [Romboutsia lituseburensis]|uniref:acetyl-CoA carboxylase biotin carboxyl carrier protein n=1 Tax=Romboutsia lituseburensis TaxID=1537 RepID=UPI00215B289F|nr:acetyl-CoA carboxylase biotin carboxyl carrier protein [Romboutsia lituseburensis]MCR8744123.1 acetyl-CoA carboxylase biotin carboxyl carrier protein [Romboutsia lituseburensis]